MDVERLPAHAEQPSAKGDTCRRRLVVGPSGAGLSAWRAVIIALIAFIGLFWVAIALLHFRGAFRLGVGGESLFVTILGSWNLLMGGYTLWVVWAVLQSYLHGYGQILLVSVGSVLWALYAALVFGLWFEPLVIPACLGLATLASLRSEYFRHSNEARRPLRHRVRPAARTVMDAPSSEAPPAPHFHPWEQPPCGEGARAAEAEAGTAEAGLTGRCIRCGSAVAENAAFCDTCRARVLNE